MGIFSWIEGEAKNAIDAIVPADIRTEIGTFAHTFVANLIHDAGAEAKTLTAPLVSEVWTYLKTAAGSLATQYAAGGISFEDLIKAGVADLKTEAATVVAPGLKLIGQQTLTNWLPNLVTTALAATATANPSSAPASSSGAPSSAASPAPSSTTKS